MKEIEEEALYLFKKYSMLELKAYLAAEIQRNAGKAGGAVEPYELQVVNQALEYHRIFTKIALRQKKEEDEGNKIKP